MIWPEINLQRVPIIGIPAYRLECPNCKGWQYLDIAQFEGREQIWCECGFMLYRDFTSVKFNKPI